MLPEHTQYDDVELNGNLKMQLKMGLVAGGPGGDDGR